MGYEPLSLRGFISEVKEVTQGAHPRRFCFVLGAGASRTSGIKTGQELVKIWDGELRERNPEEYQRWRSELGITPSNMSEHYSQYYEKRYSRIPSDGYHFLEGMMDSAKPSAGYVMLAYLLTSQPHNVVITTNFDHLTEDSVNYYVHITPLVVGHESLAHYVTSQPVRPTIVKIHRDLLFDPKSKSADLERLPEGWKNALGRIFSNYHPVFLGYAGNDPSLMDFLVENRDKFASDEWKCPYWMFYGKDCPTGKVKDFLDGSGGYVISHSGFDHVMLQLGAAFGYQLPDKASFLADAEARYQMLKDAIDALSDPKKQPDAPVADDKPAPCPDAAAETGEAQEEAEDVQRAIDAIASQSEAQRMYREASTLFDAKIYSQAAEILKKLVELEPGNARYYGKLGDALRFAGQDEEALSAYRKEVQLESGRMLGYYGMGETLQALGQPDEALEAYHKAAELDPDWGLVYYGMGKALQELGQLDEALEAYRKEVELDPSSELGYYGMGKALQKLGRPDEALEAYRKAIKADAKWAAPYAGMADVLKELGRDEEAEAANIMAENLYKQS